MINTDNLCVFEGRLTKDPEITQTNINGQQVNKAKFTIAVNRVLTQQQKAAKQQGQQIEDADFILCSCLGGTADLLQKFFVKGKPIKVIGSLRTYSTTDQATGQKTYGFGLNVDTIGFVLTDNTQNNTNGGGQQSPGQFNPNGGQGQFIPQGQFNPNGGQGFNPNVNQGFNPQQGQFNPNGGQNFNQQPTGTSVAPPPMNNNTNVGQPNMQQQFNPGMGQSQPQPQPQQQPQQQQFNPNVGQQGNVMPADGYMPNMAGNGQMQNTPGQGGMPF